VRGSFRARVNILLFATRVNHRVRGKSGEQSSSRRTWRRRGKNVGSKAAKVGGVPRSVTGTDANKYNYYLKERNKQRTARDKLRMSADCQRQIKMDDVVDRSGVNVRLSP